MGRQLLGGFTLIETLVSVFIIFLILSLITISYSEFRIKASLDASAAEVISNLNLARSKTIASDDASNYGLHFNSSNYIFFKGLVYNSNDPSNQTFSLPTYLEFLNIDIAQWPDIVFERITGATNSYGSFKIRRIGGTDEKIIKVDNSGSSYFSTTNYGTTGGIIDSRHVHFDYDRFINISPSETLDLYFDGSVLPQVQINIFNSLDTSGHFNYDGVININGENQTLKIHSHIFNSGFTPQNRLSIIRDRSKNTKSLVIKISGDNGIIISYTASGQETISGAGYSAWVSNLVRQ